MIECKIISGSSDAFILHLGSCYPYGKTINKNFMNIYLKNVTSKTCFNNLTLYYVFELL